MKSIVLLSGGLDSSVNFYKALRETEVLATLSFDYGQRACENEIRAAHVMSHRAGVRHEVIYLEWLKHLTHTALVNRQQAIPELSEDKLDDLEAAIITAEKVWVPNRNGVFINIAASYAEDLGVESIVVGFNKEEAKTFPDNSVEFMNRINQSLEYSTLKHPKVICYTADMTKGEVVRLGRELNAPFDLMWSCYESGSRVCGKCESCKRFQRAMRHV